MNGVVIYLDVFMESFWKFSIYCFRVAKGRGGVITCLAARKNVG